jgi:hypothetical protein
VAKVIEELISRYGYLITYEDPRLVYEGDFLDVTTSVRKDLDKYPPGKAPKVLVPQRGRLVLTTLPTSSLIDAPTVASLLAQTVQGGARLGQGGHFRVEQTGDVFHVVPTEARDQNGYWVSQIPILDVPITLPMQDRDRFRMLQDICNAIEAASHVKMDIPYRGGIVSPEHPQLYRLGAENERARDVLMRAFTLISTPPERITWLMFCDNQMCVINMRKVPSLASPLGGVPNRSSSSVPKTLPASPSGVTRSPLSVPSSPP